MRDYEAILAAVLAFFHREPASDCLGAKGETLVDGISYWAYPCTAG